MQTVTRIFLFTLMLAVIIPAQSVDISIGSKSKKVKTVKQDKVTYLSLNDLASKFSLKLTRSNENTRFELSTGSKSSVKFTAKNPNAVVVKDKKNKTFKMSKSARKSGNDLLIPVAASRDALAYAFDEKYSYKFPKDDTIGKEDDKETKKDDKNTKKDDKNTKKDDKTTNKEEDLNDPDAKSGKKSVITKASYDLKSNGLICNFTYTGDAAKIKHSIKEDGGKYISISVENCDITLKNVNKSFSSGPVKEVKGRVRKGNGELMIYLTDSYSSYEVKRVKSKKEVQVLVYSTSQTLNDPVKKKKDGSLM